jgi:hypothetical protein
MENGESGTSQDSRFSILDSPLPLTRRPYFAVPDRSDADVLRAFVSCFSSPSGQVVLDRLYWSTVMASPADMRGVGRQDVFREIIDTIQKGLALQRQQIGGVHG